MSPSPLRRPLLLTGFGLGAFADGIVLHQVLQWHHLVVELEPAGDRDGLAYNVLWDGVFHAGAWLTVLAGVLWLARAGADVRAASGRRVAGLLLVGWGLFNVVDQVVFHLLLEAHHIRDGEHAALYDWGFTALGVLLAALGASLAREPAAQRV